MAKSFYSNMRNGKDCHDKKQKAPKLIEFEHYKLMHYCFEMIIKMNNELTVPI